MNTNLAREVWANRRWHHIWFPTHVNLYNEPRTWCCRRCGNHTVNRKYSALSICHASPRMEQNNAARIAMGALS